MLLRNSIFHYATTGNSLAQLMTCPHREGEIYFYQCESLDSTVGFDKTVNRQFLRLYQSADNNSEGICC